MKKLGSLIRSHWIALTILVVALIVHFWFIILHPGSVLYGGPGDHTASLIWLYEKSPESPWWGQTFTSAFPFGEDLWSPTYILGQSLYILFWLCSVPFNSGIVGYNIVTTIGFIASFLSFYIVVRLLWRMNKSLAAAGSYVVAFTPFVLALNAVGHLSYVFAPAASMIAVWLFTMFLKPKNERWILYSTSLGLLIGLSWLFDPYFLLFLSLLVAALFVGWFATGGYKALKWNILYRRAGLLFVAFLIGIVPLGIYSFVQRQAISDNTSYRSSIENDAQQYSAYLEDYILPSAYNPVLPKAVVSLKENSAHGASAAPLYISSVLFIIVIVLIVLRLRAKQKLEPIIILCLVATVVMIVFSLPPKIAIGNIELFTPTYAIIQVSSAWRVFSRIFIFLYPVFCIAAFMLIHTAWKDFGKYARYALIIGLCLIPIDMLMRNPFDSSLFWNIAKDIPSTYASARISHSDKLAEYPLREAPHYKGSLYFSAQLSHSGSIINPMMPDTSKSEENIRRSLADLHNPQTVGALKFLGINKVQVWVNDGESFTAPVGLTLLTEDDYNGLFGRQKVKMYKIDEQVQPVRYIVENEKAARLWDDKVQDIKDTIVSKTRLHTVDLCTETVGGQCSQKESIDSVGFRVVNDSPVETTVTVSDSRGTSTSAYIIAPKTGQVIYAKGEGATINPSAEITILDYHVQTVSK